MKEMFHINRHFFSTILGLVSLLVLVWFSAPDKPAYAAPQDGPIQVLNANNNYFLKVDLQDSRVRVRVGLANNDTGGYETLSSMKNRYSGKGYAEWAVINGDYFGSGCPSNVNCVQGLTYIDGNFKENWSEYGTGNAATWRVRGSLGLDSSKGIQLSIGNEQSKKQMTIAGGPMIVRGGGTPTCSSTYYSSSNTTVFSTGEQFKGNQTSYCTSPSNLTMVGYSSDRRYMFMGVSKTGKTVLELAQWLKDQGASDVLKLDSGGSSGMYHNGNTILSTDGRALPNHLAVIVDNSPPPPPTGEWTAEYFGNHDWGDKKCERKFGGPNFSEDWGGGSPQGCNGMPSDNFSVRYKGRFHFDGGTYYFKINHDDGARLWVAGQQLLDRPDNSGEDCPSMNVSGDQEVQIDYRENGGGAHISLEVRTSDCAQPPSTPSNLREVGKTSSTITVGWDDVANENGYKIYKWDGSGFAYLASVGADITTYTDTGLNCAADYFYEISAFNNLGESSHTGWIKVKTSDCSLSAPLLISPSNGTAVNTGGTVTFLWQAVNDATVYYPEYWYEGQSPVNSSWQNDTQKIVGPLQPGTYQWHVKAGNPTTESGWSETRSFVIPTPCYTLNINVNSVGRGTVTPVPQPNCGSQYISGTAVTLTATASEGYSFSHWSGDIVDSNSNPTTITINSAKTVTANFEAAPTTCGSETIIEDKNLAFNYSGKWRAGNDSRASGGTYRRSATVNGTASIVVSDACNFKIKSITGSNRGIANILVDGQVIDELDAYETSSRFQAEFGPYLLPDTNQHTITIQVSGNKNGDSTGTTVFFDSIILNPGGGSPELPTIYEDKDAAVQYFGKWRKGNDARASGGTYRRSGVINGTASLTISGFSKFSITTINGSNRGKANILIDGNYIDSFDAYSPTVDYKAVFGPYPLPDAGEHTITIQVAGTKNGKSKGVNIFLDSFLLWK